MKFDIKYWLAAGLLLATALFLETRSLGVVTTPRDPLKDFPLTIGPWQGRDLGLDQEVVNMLGVEDFTNRLYEASGRLPVSLYIGYHKTQQQGASIHSPKNCLPGSGWQPIEEGYETINIPQTGSITVNRVLIQKGDQSQLVVYWYQSHGRVIASEYTAKVYMVWDAVRMNRTDGALVRVIVPIGSSAAQSQEIASSFVASILPILPKYVPN